MTTEAELEAGRAAMDAEIAAWGLPDDQIVYMCWEATAFPFAGPGHIAGQLAELRRVSGGDFVRAMLHARMDQRLDELLYLAGPILPPFRGGAT